MKKTRALARGCYAVFATGFLAAGASVLLVGTGLLPAPLKDAIVDQTRGDLHTLHLLQEFGATLVFVGLICFWFVGHYEQSQGFHWSMTAFWALFALVHWIDVRGPMRSVGGPLLTTIPVVLFVVIGVLRLANESDGPP